MFREEPSIFKKNNTKIGTMTMKSDTRAGIVSLSKFLSIVAAAEVLANKLELQPLFVDGDAAVAGRHSNFPLM